jgi:hypothetical protein
MNKRVNKADIKAEKSINIQKSFWIAIAVLTAIGIAITPKRSQASQEIGITTCQKWKADTIYGDENSTIDWLKATSGRTTWHDSDIARITDDVCLKTGNDNKTMWELSNIIREYK